MAARSGSGSSMATFTTRESLTGVTMIRSARTAAGSARSMAFCWRSGGRFATPRNFASRLSPSMSTTRCAMVRLLSTLYCVS